MDIQEENIIYEQELEPVRSWLNLANVDYEAHEFPKLVYKLVDRLLIPSMDDMLAHNYIRLGCSYSCFSHRPWFRLRALMSEDNFFPYDLRSPHFQVRRGIFLWNRFNLYTFTDLRDPDLIYVQSREPPLRWVARIRFDRNQITLTEIKE